jgi:glutamyl-Q tRNA(Asp) synthetase
LWDEAPRLQSQHVDEYEQACRDLEQSATLYPCGCSRARLAQDSLPGIDGPVYAGTCRKQAAAAARCAWRLHTGGGELQMDDAWQGALRRDLQRDIGDFIIRRADGQIGYQLACVVDEAAQRISEVVRGADLIGSSFRQVYLQQLLGLPAPAYRHLPVLVGADGRKLSKQNHAQPIEAARAGDNLNYCLTLLGQAPPPLLQAAPVGEILRWAQQQWDPRRLPGGLELAVEAAAG